jgi:hypothetical protein
VHSAIVPVLTRDDDTDSAVNAKASPTRGLFSLFPALDSTETADKRESATTTATAAANVNGVDSEPPAKAALLDASGQPARPLPNIASVERTLNKLKVGQFDTPI